MKELRKQENQKMSIQSIAIDSKCNEFERIILKKILKLRVVNFEILNCGFQRSCCFHASTSRILL